jgi:RNA polymerase sigma-70 factor, ECF subfamily
LAQHEDELVAACIRGDSAAAETLVDAYWDRVFAYAYRLTLNRSDAEDIAQETFLRAFRRLNNYKPEGQFKAWLLRIATNLFLDMKKSPQKREVPSAETGEFSKVQESPEEALGRQELLKALQDTLQTLTKEQQVVVVLRAVEHLDYGQIGVMMQLKEATVRWHMYEARRILRQRLGERFDLEKLSDE